MGLRMRKSVNLGGGMRLNLSKSGIGMSAGTKGFRVGAGPSGSRMNVGIPGTGVGYELRGGTGSRRRRSTPAQPQYAAYSQPKPKRGFFGTIFWLLKWAIIAIVVLAVLGAIL